MWVQPWEESRLMEMAPHLPPPFSFCENGGGKNPGIVFGRTFVSGSGCWLIAR